MQINIGQYWACTVSLQCTFFAVQVFAIFHNTCSREFSDYNNEFPVCYIILQHPNQPFVICIVEKNSYIRLHYIVCLAILHLLYDFPHCHVAIPTWSESITCGYEFLLIYRRKNLCNSIFHQLVFITKYAQRAHFVTSGLGEIGSSRRIGSVRSFFHPVYQTGKIRFQILLILFLAHAVDTHRLS